MPARYTFRIRWLGPDGEPHETRFRKTRDAALDELLDLTVERGRAAAMEIHNGRRFEAFRQTLGEAS